MGRQRKKNSHLHNTLSKSYYDIKSVGSYGGVKSLTRKTKLKPSRVKDWIKTQDTYTLHKPVRYKFPRRKVIVGGIGHQWQADLVDVSRLSKYNSGVRYLLTCIDVFSKKAWVVPLTDKTGASLVRAFDTIADPLPSRLQTDKGTEFTNRKFQSWLKDNRVHFFTTENEDIKASIVERFNRTMKSKLWRYFTKQDTLHYLDILQDVVSVYNRTPHRTIGMAPLDVNDKTLGQVWYRLYADSPMEYKSSEFQVGDSVRISKARRVFKKGYLPHWTEEIFTIYKIKHTQPVTFMLKDWNGEQLKGSFYAQELQKVTKTDNVYRIEKVLKEEKNRKFVKWLGYPDSFNSWVAKKDLV